MIKKIFLQGKVREFDIGHDDKYPMNQAAIGELENDIRNWFDSSWNGKVFYSSTNGKVRIYVSGVGKEDGHTSKNILREITWFITGEYDKFTPPHTFPSHANFPNMNIYYDRQQFYDLYKKNVRALKASKYKDFSADYTDFITTLTYQF